MATSYESTTRKTVQDEDDCNYLLEVEEDLEDWDEVLMEADEAELGWEIEEALYGRR